MNYDQFDAMEGESTKESVLLLLQKNPMTLDQIAKALKIDRANSWFLANVHPIDPFPVKGALSLFEVDIHKSQQNGG